MPLSEQEVEDEPLDCEQRAAVEATEKAIAVLAGPGSGKTRVLSYRARHLLQQDREAKALLLTFTNKAAAEMKARALDVAVVTSDRIWASTFHTFGMRVLRAHGDLLGLDREFEIPDDEEQGELQELAARRAGTSNRERRWSYLRLRRQQAHESEVVRWAQAYEEQKREQRVFDFDDLVVYAADLFEQHAALAQAYGTQYPHLLVDEFQDTNPAQFPIVRVLAEHAKTISVFADDDQAIYQFAGAEAKNVRRFVDELDATEYPLTTNYRCREEIVKVANRLIAAARRDRQATNAPSRGSLTRLLQERISPSGKSREGLCASRALSSLRQHRAAPTHGGRGEVSIMKRRTVAVALALGLIAAVSIVQAANSAGRPSCLVSNERTKLGSRSLQEAIDAAAAGDTLDVKGTCFGTSTINKDLTLKGVSNKQFGVATLDGSGFSGSVLIINFVTVTIDNLTIANGTATLGGGILSSGSVTLTNSTVSGNSASDGGGIFRRIYSPVTLINSTVSDNTGGGISGEFGSGLVMIDSTVSGNNGTGIVVPAGSATLTDSTVSDNTGGGIANFLGVVRLTRSTVSGNTASYGGGIRNGADGVLILTDSTVSGNTATSYGGGILSGGNSATILTDSTVSGNTASNGGGIYNSSAALELTNSTVSGNNAINGGGIYNSGPSLVGAPPVKLTNSTVSNNTASGDGGGIFNINPFSFFGSGVMLTNSTVSNNTANGNGGGIFNSFDITLTDSTVSGNTAASGGGIFNSGGTVTLAGTNIFIDNVPEDCVGVSGC